MTPIDRDAFERAIAMARAKGPAQQRQIDEKLATDPWAKVGEFAAYGCQMDSLHLKLWQPPRNCPYCRRRRRRARPWDY